MPLLDIFPRGRYNKNKRNKGACYGADTRSTRTDSRAGGTSTCRAAAAGNKAEAEAQGREFLSDIVVFHDVNLLYCDFVTTV